MAALLTLASPSIAEAQTFAPPPARSDAGGWTGVIVHSLRLLAVEHGVDYLWVSNHGGRQLDHGRGSLDVLPEVVQAAEGKARIIVDGGVQRGSDILKAVALGAEVVALGKLQAWGLAAAGTSGVVQMLEILEDELLTALALCGLPSLSQVTPAYICRAEPVTMPHEMSSWVNMPVDRVR